MTSPHDKTTNSLIPRANTSLTSIDRGERIVSRMVGEALAFARRQVVQATRRTFKVGDFELYEPDYRQVLRWAVDLDRTPDDVLGQLSRLGCDEDITLRIENGSIKDLVWDGGLLPIKSFEWEVGLELETLAIFGHSPTWPTSQLLPSLRTLRVAKLGLTELDLSPVPGLTTLWCNENQLTELDLSPVPGLTKLWCHNNQLTELDLSPVPGLTELWCLALPEFDLRPLDNPNIKPKSDEGVRIIRLAN